MDRALIAGFHAGTISRSMHEITQKVSWVYISIRFFIYLQSDSSP